MMDSFLYSSTLLLDVRSPLEYQKGHIPSAYNLPLFSDEERARVGTIYKQVGKEQAIQEGLRIVGPKLAGFVEQVKKICSTTKQIRLYCARGGMRSSSMSWLLTLAGFSCETLAGGYKTYRKWVQQQFAKPYCLSVLGGLTGSGKTALLHKMQQEGFQIIDLEHLASHKGSSFGQLNQSPQPSLEQFENALAKELFSLDPRKPIWIEDESRTIGVCPIPQPLWNQMLAAPFFWLSISTEQRIDHLLKEYGTATKDSLIEATRRLQKRLGGQKTEEITLHIAQGRLKEASCLLLEYYDKAYHFSFQKKKRKTFYWDGDLQNLSKEFLCHSR